MTALSSHSFQKRSRISMLGAAGVVELLTIRERKPDRVFDVSEGGLGVISQDPLPAGTLVLAVIALPGEKRTHDVIVRVAWLEGNAMGLEFLLPDDELVASIRRLRVDLEAA